MFKLVIKPAIACMFFLITTNISSAYAKPAENFALPTMDNLKLISLDEFSGKVIYLDFWASWCGPCRQSLPAMNSIYQKYKAEGFVVIAVNLDDNLHDALIFLDETKLDYLTVYDPNKLLPKKYGVKAMPTSFLIDRKGEIHYQHNGFKKKDIKKIDQKIKNLLLK